MEEHDLAMTLEKLVLLWSPLDKDHIIKQT